MNKTAIKNYAIWARVQLIEAAKQKAYEYAVTDGENVRELNAINGRPLSESEKRQRRELLEQIKLKGYQQVMEEAAYTWFNRFIALRFMEVNGYLPSRVRVFTDETGAFKPEILREAMTVELDGLDRAKVLDLLDRQNNDALYQYLLITQCNALNECLPQMFERIDNWTELLFPKNLLRPDGVLGKMISMIPEEDWTDQVQIIGWLYEAYNTELSDIVYDGSMSKSRITKSLLPAATTIYTPDWPVCYMVQNSLGRLWLEGHPNDVLKSEWKYYLDEAEQEPDVQAQLDTIRKEYAALKPEEIRAIDPCMGSGHILCVLFDVLVRIYEDYGYTAREAAVKIVENNLWGLDIDERAAQLSYFAVMMKARQYDRRFFTRKVQPHVYAIEESNGITSAPMHDMGLNLSQEEYGEAVKQALRLVEEMHDAKEYGSIIHVTPCNWDLLRRFAVPRDEDGQLHLDIHGEIEASARLQVLINIGEALAQKYHVVVTNPPYLSNSRFGPKLDKFIKKNYLDEKSDLSMVMYKRCLRGFSKKGGFIAFITTNSWMVLSRFQKLREYVLGSYSFDSLVDYGTELFDGKVGHNPIVSWVNRNCRINKVFTSIRLVDFCYGRRDEKEPQFFNPDNRFLSKQSDFSSIPGTPITYSFSQAVINAFAKDPSVSDRATTRLGMTTADNNRFVRLWFEVDINKTIFNAHSDEEVLKHGKKWVPYNKGGKYRKWYGNQDCVVNWYNSGFEIKNFADDKGHIRSTVPNTEYYFLPCATWSKISSGSIAFRYRDYGSIFDVAGACLYAKKGLLPLMGFLNSNVADAILSVLSPTLNYEGSHIASLPIDDRMLTNSRIEALVKESIAISKKDWDSFEFSWNFTRHPLARTNSVEKAFQLWSSECDERFFKLKHNEEELNRIFIEMYELHDEVSPEVSDRYITVSRADKERDIKSLISYAVGCMFGRYTLDSEGLAYAGGAWNQSKYQSFIPDKDAIIPICDDEYFEDDIVGRFVRFIDLVYGHEGLEDNLRYIADALHGKGASRDVLREYFINGFYADHCDSCSFGISGKRPIYWLFDSGKKNGFKCLIYMHRYQPDTIARIRTDYVHEQQERYRSQIRMIEDAMQSASTAERVKLNKQLTKFKDQALELQKYEEKIHHLADQAIPIDLDDGVKVNYAKFEDVLAKIK